jgi:signal peptidase I
MRVLRWAPVVLLVVVVAACGGSRIAIKGDSMSPTINDGETVTYQDYGSASPQRGDIVVVRHAGIIRVLRVIGLPGETVSLANGVVAIGPVALAEPYLPNGSYTDSDTKSYAVPAGSYFLLVDNRAHLGDSRGADLGFVPRAEIVGKIARAR